MKWYSPDLVYGEFRVGDSKVLAAKQRWKLPGIQCSRCGASAYYKHIAWTNGGDDTPLARDWKFIDAETWLAKRAAWAASLNVAPERLGPSVGIGLPRAVPMIVRRSSIPLLYAGIAHWWMRRDVFDALAATGHCTPDMCVPIRGWSSHVELIIETYAFTDVTHCVECGRPTSRGTPAQIHEALQRQTVHLCHPDVNSTLPALSESVVDVLVRHGVRREHFALID